MPLSTQEYRYTIKIDTSTVQGLHLGRNNDSSREKGHFEHSTEETLQPDRLATWLAEDVPLIFLVFILTL